MLFQGKQLSTTDVFKDQNTICKVRMRYLKLTKHCRSYS